MNRAVTLREVEEGDLAVFFEHQLDSEATEMAAFPSRTFDAFFQHWQKSLANRANLLRTIISQGEVAGNVVCWKQGERFQVGYWLGKAYWGKGIATLALSRLLKEVKARPLYARVAKRNVASIRVLEKCAFTVCGEDTFVDTDGSEAEEFIMKLSEN